MLRVIIRRRPRCWWSHALLGASGLLCLLSCTSPAEHSNPLDPQSPDYTVTGSIAGQVTSFYQPYQPVAGAMVHLQPTGTATRSDQDGAFTFADLSPGPYTLVVEASGYAPDTTDSEVFLRKTSRHDIRLDALPVVQSARATSAHVATRESASDRFFLEIAAEVNDRDGANDVKKVLVEIPAFSFVDTLTRGSGGATQWQRIFAPEELAPIDVNNLVGTPLNLRSVDQPGSQAASDRFFLARVIAEVPQSISPANGEILSDNVPTFSWQPLAITYGHSLRVEVFRLDAGFPAFVTAISNISAGITSVRYPGRLPTGAYFWTVKVIDDFGNSSRSKEATFQVQ